MDKVNDGGPAFSMSDKQIMFTALCRIAMGEDAPQKIADDAIAASRKAAIADAIATHPARGVVDEAALADWVRNIPVPERGFHEGWRDEEIWAWALREAAKLIHAALPAVPDGVALIAAERHRQVTAEGWTPEHDDEHTDGAMAQAGGCYALAYALEAQGSGKDSVPTPWPWDATWWKPSPADPVRQLVKAGALIAAEIDRLLRSATPAHDQPEGVI